MKSPGAVAVPSSRFYFAEILLPILDGSIGELDVNDPKFRES